MAAFTVVFAANARDILVQTGKQGACSCTMRYHCHSLADILKSLIAESSAVDFMKEVKEPLQVMHHKTVALGILGRLLGFSCFFIYRGAL